MYIVYKLWFFVLLYYLCILVGMCGEENLNPVMENLQEILTKVCEIFCFVLFFLTLLLCICGMSLTMAAQSLSRWPVQNGCGI